MERGGVVNKSLRRVLQARGVIDAEDRVFGREEFNLGWREFRVTYCATRLQTVEPVYGRPGEWAPVAQRTVELEMGHVGGDMIERIYGRVARTPTQMRQTEVQYPIGALNWDTDRIPHQ
jgi:hypothetical protein